MAGRTNELSPTEAALLALLAGGEKSGYDLARNLELSLEVMWGPAKGHMYVVLPRLVEQGWATSREVVEGKRPKKQVYRITRKGRAALKRWLEQPAEPEPDRNMLIVKLFFGDFADRDAMVGHLQRRRETAEALRNQLQAFQRTAEQGEHPELLYHWLVRRYGLMWAQMMIRWTTEAEKAIQNAKANAGERLLRPK